MSKRIPALLAGFSLLEVLGCLALSLVWFNRGHMALPVAWVFLAFVWLVSAKSWWKVHCEP